MRVLISGITGFVGSHLARAYLKNGDEVFGTYRYHHLGNEMERIEDIKDKVKLFDCDLRDRNSVFRILNEVKPDIIHHLAAQSFVKASWDNPEHTIINNITCELNIFEVCRDLKIDPVIHVAGSSEEYGKQDKMPISEDAPLRPLSPYAVSKVAQDALAQQYHSSYGTKTVITRAFNHEGPGRGKDFVTSAFAIQAAKILKNNELAIIYVGNLEAIRDYTDISDMVRAYMIAVKKCSYGQPYNICSGTGHKIREILDFYTEKIRLRFSNFEVKNKEELMRPSDLPILVGDCRKFKEATGWVPEVNFEEMLNKIYLFWQEKI